MWRDSGPAFTWNGPYHLLVGEVTLQAIENSGGRFIQVDGAYFTPSSGVKVSYDIFTGGSPDTHQTGQNAVSTGPDGTFSDAIKVNLPDVAGANVRALDDSTQMAVDASI
jgi:hypothetical protein